MNALKKATLTAVIALALFLSFTMGVKFALDNQKIVTTGGTGAKSSVLFYHKEYYVNPNHINWGIIID